MQNDQMTIRGYSPQQNTGRMTAPVQPVSAWDQIKRVWRMLDPNAVMLLAAAVLGLAYALYATISFWWLTKVLAHLILVWLTVGITGIALISGKREMMLVSAICYVISMILFVNFFYLLLPQTVLCLCAWWKAAE